METKKEANLREFKELTRDLSPRQIKIVILYMNWLLFVERVERAIYAPWRWLDKLLSRIIPIQERK